MLQIKLRSFRTEISNNWINMLRYPLTHSCQSVWYSSFVSFLLTWKLHQIIKFSRITVVLYLILTAFATYKSYVNPHPEQGIFFSFYVYFVIIFVLAHIIVKALSLVTNWRKLCSLNDRPDFQKLKFIQGIRFYNMLLVIFCHTLCSYIGGYVANTEYFELVLNPLLKLYWFKLNPLLI